MTTLTKDQKKKFRVDYITADGRPEVLVATVRHDDECGNGHNTFSITAHLYDRTDRNPDEPTAKHKDGAVLWLGSCGCLHELIAERIPELAPLVKWHLTSTDGPMHYIANTVYRASDRDHHGLRKGEQRQLKNGKTGLPCWELVVVNPPKSKQVDAEVCPTDVPTMEWRPWCIEGEGKARELDAARRCAVWPEATDEQLMADDLREQLVARLPQLLADFQAAVESLGFVY